ncbi:alpha-hydroxy-acid oxidizing protein [Dietzia cinnamea]|uniref:alpha-hydroxy-acid oxidizing protein n=1 Tax=Dietzia cinnamea TaxID=321318 RepID=UPI0021AF917C|nr:alpha-hydroxy-acid oxidizing protein [Dietzia cinnamea]MCT2062353.1 alpha-hydroxy-acid oxidizing protein [Dietzia cinnamea]MCT2236851.1 alpha-hydroxy-acid oxidizing protein [Dietzia cinnamea]
MPTPPGPFGRARQNVLYRAGISGIMPKVPTGPERLEAAARRALLRRPGGRKAWAYIYGGAGAGRTMDANREAFDRRRVIPRMLRDTTDRDLTVELLGRRLPAPVLVAPIGAAGLITSGADLDVGAAAAQRGLPYILSSQGSSPMEATAAEMDAAGGVGAAPRWFQLYWSSDEELVDSFLSRAEEIDADAVVVTLDTTQLGWRPWDLDLGSLPFTRGVGIAQYTSDPRFSELVAERIAADEPEAPVKVTPQAVRTLLEMARNHPGGLLDNLRAPEPRAAVQTFLDTFSNPALSWDHITTLRERTRLPVVLKGVLHPDDARRAVDLGVDAVMVSNHGGRQVDGEVLDNLLAEIDLTMGLAGVRSWDEVDGGLLT